MSVVDPVLLVPLLQGFVTTLALTVTAAVGAFVLGVPLCIARIQPIRWIAWAGSALVTVLRNTPLLLQLLFWYFGASQLLPLSWRAWLLTLGQGVLPGYEALVAWLGLTIYSAAFVSEEIRAGLRAVPSGQIVAAAALGLTRAQAWRHVVLPQALRIARQPLAGQVMNIAKNSSLSMAIGVAELSYATRQVESQTFRSLETYAWSTVLYIALIASIGAWSQSRGRNDLQRMQVRR